MDKVDEGCRTISWPKWHDGVCPFDHINPLECQFLLACFFHSELMIAHPPPFATAELVEYCRITLWDGVCYVVSDAIEWDVIDSKAPNEVFDVTDVLLVGLGSK